MLTNRQRKSYRRTITLLVILSLTLVALLTVHERRHRKQAVTLAATQTVLEETADQFTRTNFMLQALDIDPESPWYQTPGIRITTYQAVKKQCDSRPWETASGAVVNYHTVAISPDLRDRLGWQLGDRLFVPGFGLMYINDLTNARLRKTVDILVPASAYGRYSRNGVTVMWIPRRG